MTFCRQDLCPQLRQWVGRICFRLVCSTIAISGPLESVHQGPIHRVLQVNRDRFTPPSGRCQQSNGGKNGPICRAVAAFVVGLTFEDTAAHLANPTLRFQASHFFWIAGQAPHPFEGAAQLLTGRTGVAKAHINGGTSRHDEPPVFQRTNSN